MCEMVCVNEPYGQVAAFTHLCQDRIGRIKYKQWEGLVDRTGSMSDWFDLQVESELTFFRMIDCRPSGTMT